MWICFPRCIFFKLSLPQKMVLNVNTVLKIYKPLVILMLSFFYLTTRLCMFMLAHHTVQPLQGCPRVWWVVQGSRRSPTTVVPFCCQHIWNFGSFVDLYFSPFHPLFLYLHSTHVLTNVSRMLANVTSLHCLIIISTQQFNSQKVYMKVYPINLWSLES